MFNKKGLNLRKVATIAASLAVTTIFVSCKSNKEITQLAQKHRMEVADKPIGKITENGDTLRIVREVTFIGNDSVTRTVRAMSSSNAPIVKFAVKKDGTIRNARIVHSSGNPLIDAEAIRVTSAAPKWDPPFRKSTGKPINVTVRYPMSYTFIDSELITDFTALSEFYKFLALQQKREIE